MPINKARALELGKKALTHLKQTAPEMLEQARNPPDFRNLKLKQFLTQYCWVVYASGFRYAVVENKFPELQEVFKNFDPEKLLRMRSIKPVLRVFNNKNKATSFLSGAQTIIREGFGSFKRRLNVDGLPQIDILETLPGIGPITKKHLAKNIGLADVAKDDIWLERAKAHCGARSVPELVTYISSQLGESNNVIDVAVWAYGKDLNFRHLKSSRKPRGR